MDARPHERNCWTGHVGIVADGEALSRFPLDSRAAGWADKKRPWRFLLLILLRLVQTIRALLHRLRDGVKVPAAFPVIQRVSRR